MGGGVYGGRNGAEWGGMGRIYDSGRKMTFVPGALETKWVVYVTCQSQRGRVVCSTCCDGGPFVRLRNGRPPQQVLHTGRPRMTGDVHHPPRLTLRDIGVARRCADAASGHPPVGGRKLGAYRLEPARWGPREALTHDVWMQIKKDSLVNMGAVVMPDAGVGGNGSSCHALSRTKGRAGYRH